MADQSVAIEEPVASTAYKMAINLWREKHDDRNPNMDDEDFIKLVSSCVYALKGAYKRYEF